MPDAVKWYPDELKFIKDNYYSMTNDEIINHINSHRSIPLKKSSMLHQARRLGLRREIQIRWSKEDTVYLKKVYHKYGDTELARRLNGRYSTYRIIDGKKVFRKFTKKHVNKKRQLLGLKRTDKQLEAILKRNRESGNHTGYFTKGRNKWTINPHLVMKEGETCIQKNKNAHRLMIKINGRLIPYHRWYYHNHVRTLTSKEYVMFKDLDALNCDLDNMYVSTCKSITNECREEGISLLEDRVTLHLMIINTNTDRAKEKELMKELARLRSLIRHFK